MANFAVGAAFTWRRATDWSQRPRLGGLCTGETNLDNCPVIGPQQYVPGGSGTLNGVTVTSFVPPAALVTAAAGGRILTNRDGYFSTFKGFELAATKRLANRWMSRVAFSFNDWTEDWEDGVTPSTGGVLATNAPGNPTRIETDPLVPGGQVSILSGGSGKASFYSSIKWQLHANALVELPWDIQVSGGVFAKQGSPFPNAVRLSAGSDGTLSVLATPEVDTQRYDNLYNVDLRLAKTINLGRARMIFSGEAFNVFNNDVVLARFRWAGPTFRRIEEILAPRTFRVGARFVF